MRIDQAISTILSWRGRDAHAGELRRLDERVSGLANDDDARRAAAAWLAGGAGVVVAEVERAAASAPPAKLVEVLRALWVVVQENPVELDLDLELTKLGRDFAAVVRAAARGPAPVRGSAGDPAAARLAVQEWVRRRRERLVAGMAATCGPPKGW